MNSKTATDFPENCYGYLNQLAKSPTFAMSLGAKELFHTNFLAFLLESQDPSVINIQKELKELLFGHENIGRVITWREKESLDLVIMPAPKRNDPLETPCKSAELEYKCTNKECKHTDKQCKHPIDYCDTIAVVIEAKLKSIPTQQQLDGYDAKLIKGIDFELDDVDPENDTENDVDPGIGYEQDNEQKWKVMRLKLFSDGGVGKCNPKCTIQARSDKSQVEKGLLKKFTGTVRRILLRPMGTSTVDSPKIGCWEQMNWQDIVEALNYNREDDACKNQLESVELRTCEDTDLLLRIISDYRDSLKQLLLILRKTFDYVKLSTDQKSTVTYQKYYEAITATKFKSSRIHDLVGKYASHIFEQHILEIISGTLANAVGNSANCVDCSSTKISQQPTTSFYICGFEFTLNSYTHFSNQQPGLGFEWIAKKQVGKEKKERKILFGVQIQGNHYRHYISADGGEPAQRKDVLSSLATMLTTNTSIPIDWFLDNSIFKLPNSPSFIKKESKKKKNLKTATFYAFGQDKFLYSKADISSVQISYLAQIVCRSLCSARQIISSQHNIICNSIKTFFPEPLQTDL